MGVQLRWWQPQHRGRDHDQWAPGSHGNRHVSNIVNFRNKNLPKFGQKFNQTLSMTVGVNAAMDWNAIGILFNIRN